MAAEEKGLMKEYRVMIGQNNVFGIGGPINQCGVIYSAYRENGGAIVEERGRVLLSCDEAGYRRYLKKIEYYSVLRIRAEKKEDDFFAAEFTEINAKPTVDEKAFLDLAAAPVVFTDPQFGKFTQDKAFGGFEGEITHDGKSLHVFLEEREDIETLRWIFSRPDTFWEEAALYAAENLLELGNDWARQEWVGDEKDFTPMTGDDFTARIELNEISLSENESFVLFYDDGDIFWGHVIEVAGNKAAGFTDAYMEG